MVGGGGWLKFKSTTIYLLKLNNLNESNKNKIQVIKLHHMLMLLNIKLSWRFRSVSGLDDSLDIDIKDIRITSTAAVNLLVLQILGDIVQRDYGGLLLQVLGDVTHVAYLVGIELLHQFTATINAFKIITKHQGNRFVF